MSTKSSDNVFINCPFDENYADLFRACVFTVLDAGFIPRCSLERDDATASRLGNILELIDNCSYGIHDLSRVEIDKTSQLPRFNMPFELGLFLSAKHFGSSNHKQKKCVIFEAEQNRYQHFISDIAGMDIKPHNNSSEKLILSLRNWLYTSSRRTTIPQGEEIYKRFREFQLKIKDACGKRGVNYDVITFIDLVNNMTDWLKINQIIYTPLIS